MCRKDASVHIRPEPLSAASDIGVGMIIVALANTVFFNVPIVSGNYVVHDAAP